MTAVCHEPGFHTIFEEASPTFKMRFMYMSGITDEAEFDEFRKTHDLGGPRREDPRAVPLRGRRADELSPLEHTERLMKALQGPKRLVVYQDSRVCARARQGCGDLHRAPRAHW